VEGKFSLWFLAALALSEGNVTLDKFTDAKVNDPGLITLRQKINAKLVRELKLGARVAVRMKDGKEYKKFLKAPKGSPENPMSFREIGTKFRNAAKPTISDENVERLIEKIKSLEELQDIAEIISLIQRT